MSRSSSGEKKRGRPSVLVDEGNDPPIKKSRAHLTESAGEFEVDDIMKYAKSKEKQNVRFTFLIT
jgi:hypothetical protein